MFDQFKELAKLRELQKQIQNQRVEMEREGVKVVINGSMKIDHLVLNPDLDAEKQAQIIRDLVNEGIEKLQKSIAQIMQQAQQ